MDFALDDSQQGRFAGSVCPDKPDLPTGRYGRRRLIEQDAAFNEVGEVIYMQHSGRAFTPALTGVKGAAVLK